MVMVGSPLTREFANRRQTVIQGQGRFTERGATTGHTACNVKEI